MPTTLSTLFRIFGRLLGAYFGIRSSEDPSTQRAVGLPRLQIEQAVLLKRWISSMASRLRDEALTNEKARRRPKRAKVATMLAYQFDHLALTLETFEVRLRRS